MHVLNMAEGLVFGKADIISRSSCSCFQSYVFSVYRKKHVFFVIQLATCIYIHYNNATISTLFWCTMVFAYYYVYVVICYRMLRTLAPGICLHLNITSFY